DESVDRLDRIDGVATRDRYAGGRAGRLSAVEDSADGVQRQAVDRHRHEGKREDRPAAHRIDVRYRIGGGDPPEVERIIDDRHEEVGRRHQRPGLVDLVDRGVVGGLDPDQQLGWQRQWAGPPEDVGKYAGRDLAAAASPVGERGQPQRLVGRGGGGDGVLRCGGAHDGRCAVRSSRAQESTRPAMPPATWWKPPSTYVTAAVIPLARSESRKAAALPTSSMVTLRLSGALAALKSSMREKFLIPLAASVLMGPAEIAFTRIPLGPRLSAMNRTDASRLALASPIML